MVRFFSAFALALPLIGCGSDDAGPVTPDTVATMPGAIRQLAAVDGDVFSSIDGESLGEIAKVTAANGDITTFADMQPAAAIVATGTHVLWRNFYASMSGTWFQIAGAPRAGGSPTIYAETGDALAADTEHVYWAIEVDEFMDLYQIWRAPIGGGEPAMLAADVLELNALALDGDTLYFSARGGNQYQIFAMPKSGGTPTVIGDDVSGLGGAGHLIAGDERIYFLASTGGGATSNFAASVPKTGGERIEHPFTCQRVIGIALAGDSLYATCDKDIQGFETTDVHTLRRAPAGGGSARLVAKLPAIEGEDHGFTAPAIDGDSIYIGYGTQLLHVAR